MQASMKHAVKHLGFPETAVETVAEFRQISGQMLGADAVVNTPDIALYIGDQGMNPGQNLGRFLPEPGTSHSCWRPGEASRKL